MPLKERIQAFLNST